MSFVCYLQDPNTITHTAHPEMGELYADVHLDKSKKKKEKKAEEESAGAMYQVWQQSIYSGP